LPSNQVRPLSVYGSMRLRRRSYTQPNPPTSPPAAPLRACGAGRAQPLASDPVRPEPSSAARPGPSQGALYFLKVYRHLPREVQIRPRRPISEFRLVPSRHLGGESPNERDQAESDDRLLIGGREPGGDLSAGVESELVQDAADVAVDRAFGDEEVSSDLLVASAIGHQSCDICLTPPEKP
jgi:hypothetical protein